jgi:hypothetical protein
VNYFRHKPQRFLGGALLCAFATPEPNFLCANQL